MSSTAVRVTQSERPATPSSALFDSLAKRLFLMSLVLAVFTLVLYNRANQFPFLNYDDNRYIIENLHTQAGLTWSTLRWAFTTFEFANWHPLTWMSHALDCQLFHLNSAGHHFTSILLHAVNVVLLFLLLARGTRRELPSFLVAALFAVHPVNVESVVWIAERKNLLSTLFFLLAVGAYGWYALKPGWKRYCAVAGLLACSLMSKPMLVTAPFLLLLLDYWPLGRIRGRSVASEMAGIEQFPLSKLSVEKLPLLLLSAASSVIAIRAQRASGAVGASPFPPGARLENGIYSYGRYLWKAFWPADLTLLYPWAGHSVSLWKVCVAGLLLVATTFFVLKMRTRGYLLTGWFWFLGTLVPVIGVIQVGNQAMADRYAYVPLIGLFLMIAWGFADWAASRKWSLAVQTAPAICVLAALSVASYQQIGYWRDSLTVWAHALKVTQHNFVAEDNMGVALTQLNHADQAYSFFVQAAQDEPNDPVARLNIGTYLDQHGRTAQAIEQYELVLHLGSEPGLLAAAYANLGLAYGELGDYAKSRSSFEQSIRLNPNQASAWQGMALLSVRQGKLDEAISSYEQYLELQPSAPGFMQLARLLAQANHRQAAIAAYQQAVRMDPNIAQTQSVGPR